MSITDDDITTTKLTTGPADADGTDGDSGGDADGTDGDSGGDSDGTDN